MNSAQEQRNGKSRLRLHGQATVELALIFALLLALLVGVADIVRAYSEHLAVVHAANSAARWATLNTTQQMCSQVRNVETAVALDLERVPITVLNVQTRVAQPTTV